MRGYRSEDRSKNSQQFKPGPPVKIPGAACAHATDKAILVRIAGRQLWVPQSAIHDDSEVYQKGDSGLLVVKHWWASRNGYTEKCGAD